VQLGAKLRAGVSHVGAWREILLSKSSGACVEYEIFRLSTLFLYNVYRFYIFECWDDPMTFGKRNAF
jgi:hypothetical protein